MTTAPDTTRPRIDDATAEAIFRAHEYVRQCANRHADAKAAAKEAREILDDAQAALNTLIDDAKDGQGGLFDDDNPDDLTEARETLDAIQSEPMRTLVSGNTGDVANLLPTITDATVLESALACVPPGRRADAILSRMDELAEQQRT